MNSDSVVASAMGQVMCCDTAQSQCTPRGARSQTWGSTGTWRWSPPEDTSRRAEQLELELRLLREENYKAREEALRHVRGGEPDMFGTRYTPMTRSPGSGGDVGPQSGAGRVDLEQQLTYMRELVRSLQNENERLKESNRSAEHAGAVDEAEYRALQQKMMSLQQAHLNQLQEARQLQLKSPWLNTAGPASSGPTSSGTCVSGSLHGLTTTAGSGGSRGVSGMSTPGQGSCATPGSQMQYLQSQYQSLVVEQEQLRGKVRRLAYNR